MENIEKQIEKLPSLPEHIKQMKYLLHTQDYEVENLLDILEKNIFLKVKLLKLANSGLFKFGSSVDTLSRTVNLYGMHFSLAFSIFQSLKYILKPNLIAYDCSTKKHDNISELSCLLLFTWFRKSDIELEEKLLLPLLCSELGRYIVSDMIIREDKKELFIRFLKEGNILEDIEKEHLEITCSNISAKILRKWNFDGEIIYLLSNVDDKKLCQKHKELAVLNVIKTVCNIHNPFSLGNINRAMIKAEEFNLDTKSFKESVEIVLKRLKKEKKRS